MISAAVAITGYWRGAPKKKKNESDVYLADDKSGTMVPPFFF
jgi:hypothetical protein